MLENQDHKLAEDLQLVKAFIGSISDQERLNLALYLATGSVEKRGPFTALTAHLAEQLGILGVDHHDIMANLSHNNDNFESESPQERVLTYCKKDSRGLQVTLAPKELDMLLQGDIPDALVRARVIKVLFTDRVYAPKIFDLVSANPLKKPESDDLDEETEVEETNAKVFFIGNTKDAVRRIKDKKGLSNEGASNGEVQNLFPEQKKPENLEVLGTTAEEIQAKKTAINIDSEPKGAEVVHLNRLSKRQLAKKIAKTQQTLRRLIIEVANKAATLEWINNPDAELQIPEDVKETLDKVKEENIADFVLAENFEEALRAFLRVYHGQQNDISLHRRRLRASLISENS